MIYLIVRYEKMKFRYKGKMYSWYLEDDGTLDTVINLEGKTYRLNSECIRRHQRGKHIFEPFVLDIKEICISILEGE